ncbi:bifunctional phosphoribosylaminoimidazolecarboxamide formyltransferase/IMP cyclohydrolase [Acetobacteraceae bacterium]|nr:bifunctional phosphoribosylaminoimidazolecarboxamide formyltransferase/IMP cyclohydrolase [Candidatus Parcubacteria bacterium]
MWKEHPLAKKQIGPFALVSVTDKTRIGEVAAVLAKYDFQLLSTGGTAKVLAAAELAVIEVSALTGIPEMMDGRVKTLHPVIHGGLLAVRSNPEHMEALDRLGGGGIDVLIVNLYPFAETVAKGADFDTCAEEIDIGGPAMIRGAAKNHNDVLIVVDPEDYNDLVAELETNNGVVKAEFRRRMAAKAFSYTAWYDSAIAAWLRGQVGELLPKYFTVGGIRKQVCRYGENPHQAGAIYLTGENRPGAATARQVAGKEMSLNNYADADAAFELVGEFGATVPTCVIVKHANPCGVAQGMDQKQAYRRAVECDRTSAFGGVVAFNQILELSTALEIAKIFTEVVIAPDATEAAIEVIGSKPGIRLLLTGGLPDPRATGLTVKPIAGGLLVQTRDNKVETELDFGIVTRRGPTHAEAEDLRFAWTVAKHVKSNAIVFARHMRTVGVGAGQMSRVDSVHIAAQKAQEMAKALDLPHPTTKGSVVASDAFFPFADGLIAAIVAGATAAIQPGGSKNDAEVIKAANDRDVAMVFTKVRHFRH